VRASNTYFNEKIKKKVKDCTKTIIKRIILIALLFHKLAYDDHISPLLRHGKRRFLNSLFSNVLTLPSTVDKARLYFGDVLRDHLSLLRENELIFTCYNSNADRVVQTS
jgi:hypothetical protein